MTTIPKYLLGLDVEASGMGLRSNFLIQIGLALIDTETLEVLNRFSSYVAQPQGTCWEQRCVDEFWSKHTRLFKQAQERVADAPDSETVRKDLLFWINENVCDPSNTRLVVDTPGFDTSWLDTLLGDRSHLYLFSDKSGNPVYTDVLERSSWFLGLGKVPDPDGSSKTTAKNVMKANGIDTEWPVHVMHTHDAADDAAFIAVTTAYVMNGLCK